MYVAQHQLTGQINIGILTDIFWVTYLLSDLKMYFNLFGLFGFSKINKYFTF